MNPELKTGLPPLNPSDLDILQRQHSFGWTFENFDVYLTGTNRLDRDGLEAKLGLQNRGGWCFELNEWLALRLEDAGFRVRRLMARTLVAAGRPRTHQIVLVETSDGLWTADAGFGAQTPREAMRLESGFERDHDGVPYRLECRTAGQGALAEPDAWVLQIRSSGGWKDLYQFTLETATTADFAMGNHFHLTNPTSSFAEARFATRPVPGGRLTLIDRTLKVWTNTSAGEQLAEERVIPDRSTWASLLEQHFGILLPGTAIDRLWNLEPAVSRRSTPST